MRFIPNKRLVQAALPTRDHPVHLHNKQSCSVMEYAKWMLIILEPQAGEEQGRNCSWKSPCTHRPCQPYHERQPECSGMFTNSDLHSVIVGIRTVVYSLHLDPLLHPVHCTPSSPGYLHGFSLVARGCVFFCTLLNFYLLEVVPAAGVRQPKFWVLALRPGPWPWPGATTVQLRWQAPQWLIRHCRPPLVRRRRVIPAHLITGQTQRHAFPALMSHNCL